MHKLFVLSHLRTLQRLGVAEFNPSNFDEISTRNNLVLSGQGLLYRLPREEIKHILNTRCPINSLQETHSEAIIKSSKLLRHHVKMDEAKVCSTCPFVKECNYAKKQLQELKYQNTIKDLLIFFHGLQNYLKPENIFYRQWVSAYRLGDSLIASIEDLSKGGKEIEQYDRIRLEGIKQFQEKMAEKKKNSPSDKSDKQFQNVMSKVEAITSQKAKADRPKDLHKQKAKQTETLGRDFSFDEEAQFEPVNKFSKNSSEKAQPRQSLKGNQKGYQRIQGDSDGFNKNEGKPSYNKFRPEKQSIEEFEDEFKKFKPREERPVRKQYQREDRGYKKDYDRQGGYKKNYEDRGYKREDDRNLGYRKNFDREGSYSKKNYEDSGYKKKYDNEARGSRNQWSSSQNEGGYKKEYQSNKYGQQNNRYENKGDRFERGGQSGYNKYNSRTKYEDSEQHPKIRQFGKKQYNKPRESFAPEQYTKKEPKVNPFVNKWKDNSGQNSFESSKIDSQASFKKGSDFEASASDRKPRIIQVESIKTNDQSQGSRGRSVGRRRRSPKPDSEQV